MGKVVKLEPQAKDRTGATARSRAGRSKTALVLGGGGFTGGVYEIGALRALDLLTVNRTVNDFDVYVGTSAGSFVAAMISNGVTPEEMMRVVDRQRPTRRAPGASRGRSSSAGPPRCRRSPAWRRRATRAARAGLRGGGASS